MQWIFDTAVDKSVGGWVHQMQSPLIVLQPEVPTSLRNSPPQPSTEENAHNAAPHTNICSLFLIRFSLLVTAYLIGLVALAVLYNY